MAPSKGEPFWRWLSAAFLLGSPMTVSTVQGATADSSLKWLSCRYDGHIQFDGHDIGPVWIQNKDPDLGIQLKQDAEGVKVTTILPGAGYNAGIEPGDVIVAVKMLPAAQTARSVQTAQWLQPTPPPQPTVTPPPAQTVKTVSEAWDLIRVGDSARAIEIEVQRDGEPQLKPLTVYRDFYQSTVKIPVTSNGRRIRLRGHFVIVLDDTKSAVEFYDPQSRTLESSYRDLQNVTWNAGDPKLLTANGSQVVYDRWQNVTGRFRLTIDRRTGNLQYGFSADRYFEGLPSTSTDGLYSPQWPFSFTLDSYKNTITGNCRSLATAPTPSSPKF